MRLIDKTPQVDRRSFLATTGAALVVTATAVMCPTESWALEAKNLKPETVRTLIKMSRDVYPHDRLADRFYAVAVKGMDDKATEGAPLKTTLEEGVAKLDAAAKAAYGVPYADVGWEHQRVKLLRARMADSLPASETPTYQVLRTDSPSFRQWVDARANRRDAFFIKPAGGADICNIPVPVRRVQ